VIGSGIDVSVGSLEMLHLASAAAQQAERRARVHLKIDTGMGRNGAAPSLARDIGRTVRDDEFLQLVAAWTHLTSADDPADPATDQQVEVFDSTCEALADEVGPIPLQHIANSAALLSRPGLHRAGSDRCEVLVRTAAGDRRVPQVGRISMDQIVVDLGPDSEAAPGDEVVIFGDSWRAPHEPSAVRADERPVACGKNPCDGLN